MKNTNLLFCISSLDGRYHDTTKILAPYFSEFALIKKRILIEGKYLMLLSDNKIIRTFSDQEKSFFYDLITNFSLEDAEAIKKNEEKYKHDVKAVEYFLREALAETSLKDISHYIHFGLTSEDINNLSLSLLLHESNQEVIIPHIKQILTIIQNLGMEYRKTPVLALTHGQPAVPTTFGKELAVFYERIEKISQKLEEYQFEGKLNGAVGNYNALHFVFPNTDWMEKGNEFISSLGLVPNNATTQILPADNMAEYFDRIKLLNSIFIDLCQDMWLYISRELLGIKKEKDQVGSSTMPQKINPIAFENAEGNLYVANSLLELYSRKLPVSRMQRDLTDSTIKRTFGTALGHTVLAWTNMSKGLGQIQVNSENMLQELQKHGESVAEGLQVYLKQRGDQKGYETVQKLFQGKKVSPEQFTELMKELEILVDISPESYLGIAEGIAERILTK